MRSIDYYFTLLSPFAYLGHRAFLDVARKHGAEVRYKPISIMDVWEDSGAVPVPQRPKARQDYRMIELQRWREVRGVALTLKPKHFPTSPVLADRTVIALVNNGDDPADYIEAVFQALWVDEEDIAQDSVLAQRLGDTDHDAESVLKSAKTDLSAEIHERNTADAVAAQAIGSPCYVLDGEPFWGQDRIGLLDAALTTGRKPFTA
ncbi:MAG: 2-hydroxychromene-2-carboxylate isomerase [Hyphomicrobiales bacterium]|nr:2-hydroxychromene-2-carboxylate isomerase [Hyphomicrobiales bacterium]